MDRAAFGKRWIFIAVCWLPPPFLMPFLLFDISQLGFRSLLPEGCQPTLSWPSSQSTPSCSASTFRGVVYWEEVLPVEIRSKGIFPFLHWKFSTCTSIQKRRVQQHWENQLFTPGSGEGFCGTVWVVQHHAVLFPIPSSGVTQTVIKRAGRDSRNITTFSHFNLFWSSWAFQAHSIWYFLLQRFFLLQLPSISFPHPPPHLVLHLVYLFTLKRKGIYCSFHIKWSSCNRNKLLVPI